jgi:hypothetical protein
MRETRHPMDLPRVEKGSAFGHPEHGSHGGGKNRDDRQVVARAQTMAAAPAGVRLDLMIGTQASAVARRRGASKHRDT